MLARLIILQTCKRNGRNLARSCKNLGCLHGFLQDVSDLGRPDIQVSCKTLLYGETTANTLAYTSYLLALNPDIQEILQSEIDNYFDEKPVRQ